MPTNPIPAELVERYRLLAGAPLRRRDIDDASFVVEIAEIAARAFLDGQRELRALFLRYEKHFRHRADCSYTSAMSDPDGDFCNCGYAEAVKTIQDAIRRAAVERREGETK